MWLTARPSPASAASSKDQEAIPGIVSPEDGPAIRRTCACFVEPCRRPQRCLRRHRQEQVQDGQQPGRDVIKRKIASRLAHLEADAERCIGEIVRIDRQEAGDARAERLAQPGKRRGRLLQEIECPNAMGEALAEAPDGQISLTGPDARAMAISARGSGHAGCNIQSAVDAGTPLIVAHEATSQGFGRDQPAPMAKAAKTALGRKGLHAPADKGCFRSAGILACHKIGITTAVPHPEASGNRSKGMFVKAGFACGASKDVYHCPAGQVLSYR